MAHATSCNWPFDRELTAYHGILTLGTTQHPNRLLL